MFDRLGREVLGIVGLGVEEQRRLDILEAASADDCEDASALLTIGQRVQVHVPVVNPLVEVDFGGVIW